MPSIDDKKKKKRLSGGLATVSKLSMLKFNLIAYAKRERWWGRLNFPKMATAISPIPHALLSI